MVDRQGQQGQLVRQERKGLRDQQEQPGQPEEQDQPEVPEQQDQLVHKASRELRERLGPLVFKE